MPRPDFLQPYDGQIESLRRELADWRRSDQPSFAWAHPNGEIGVEAGRLEDGSLDVVLYDDTGAELARLSDILSGGGGGGHDHDDRYYTETEIDVIVAAINAALAGKAALVHTHAIADVTALQATLDAKETPAGAQAKADDAEADANDYTDAAIAGIELDPEPTYDQLLGIPLKTKHVETLGADANPTVTHNLGTYEVDVAVVENATGQSWLVVFGWTSKDAIELTFTDVPGAGDYDVIVTRRGADGRRHQATYSGASPQTITHNLGTERVTVKVRNAAGELVLVAWTITSANALELDHSPSPSSGDFFVTVDG